MSCGCAACKKGVKVGKPPKAGTDTRPWAVLDDDGNEVVRCWEEETARNVAKLKGTGHSVAKRQRRRKKARR